MIPAPEATETIGIRPAGAEAAVLVALGRAWDVVRERHAEVPPVILVVGPSPRRGRWHTLGCFRNFGWSLPATEPTEIQAARREAAAAVQRGDLAAAWQANADALYWSFAQLTRESYTIVSEVFIATEVLEAGAEDVLTILLPWRRGRIQTLGMP
jgi:hypothetical protein